MQLPETTNANHIYAFKKGYRYAQEGKPLSYMPSQIRHDGKMCEYFQQGWEQFQEELTSGEQAEHDSPWRSRLAWLLMSVVAGLGTASLMVSQMQADPKLTASQKPAQTTTHTAKPSLPPQPEISHPKPDESQPVLSLMTPVTPPALDQTTPSKPAQPTPQPTPKSTLEPTANADESPPPVLRLLTPQAHKDLAAQKQNQTSYPSYTPQPIIVSTIKVRQLQLCQQIQHRQCQQPLQSKIPPYIRKLYLFTQIDHAKGKTLTHRWIYKNQIMAEILLPIKSDHYRTWSSKRLSRAWRGKWIVEVLDDQHQPIARTTFIYAK